MIATIDDGGGASYKPFGMVEWFWYWTAFVITQAFIKGD